MYMTIQECSQISQITYRNILSGKTEKSFVFFRISFAYFRSKPPKEDCCFLKNFLHILFLHTNTHKKMKVAIRKSNFLIFTLCTTLPTVQDMAIIFKLIKMPIIACVATKYKGELWTNMF